MAGTMARREASAAEHKRGRVSIHDRGDRLLNQPALADPCRTDNVHAGRPTALDDVGEAVLYQAQLTVSTHHRALPASAAGALVVRHPGQPPSPELRAIRPRHPQRITEPETGGQPTGPFGDQDRSRRSLFP
jgi:hypothetical protein